MKHNLVSILTATLLTVWVGLASAQIEEPSDIMLSRNYEQLTPIETSTWVLQQERSERVNDILLVLLTGGVVAYSNGHPDLGSPLVTTGCIGLLLNRVHKRRAQRRITERVK